MKKSFYLVSGFFILLSAFWISVEFSVKTEAVEDKQPQTVQKNASKAENSIPKNLHFNLKVNTEYLELINNSSQELVEGNSNKFGGDLGKSSINIHIKDFRILQTTNNKEEYEASTKGVIKSITGNYNFNGTGMMYKIKLSTGEWVYSGSFEGTFKNKSNEENFVITIRYNPNTEESDIVFASGLLGNTGILPFGQPFIMEEELAEIQAITVQTEESGE